MPITSTRDCLLVWLRNSETFKSNRIALGEEYIVGTLDAVDAPCYFEALPGEVVVKKIENAFYSIVADAKSNTTIFSSPGSMHISVYRIALTSSKRTSYSGDHYHSRYDDIPFFNSISIPLCNIHKIFISQPNSTINVICKDFRHIRISLEKDEELKVEGLTQLIELMIFNRNYIEYENPYGHIFAFKYHNLFSHDGWDFSDMRSEYIRQGLDDEAKWQASSNHSLSSYI